MTPQAYRYESYGHIRVAYTPALDGGGRDFGQSFKPLVRYLFGHVHHVLEWASGPGFIGFSLLAPYHCRLLTLADINPVAVEAVKTTIDQNQLQREVSVYQSDALTGLPSGLQVNLIVANPPHFAGPWDGQHPDEVLKAVDAGWQIHERFYQQAAQHLTLSGSILMQENTKGSRPEDFLPMIEAGGLTLLQVFTVWSARPKDATKYFLWIKRRDPHITPRRCLLE